MVREGLIGEIITTNYDCCIETAFEESLSDPNKAQDKLAAVTTLELYRSKAANYAEPDELLLYKINGCAKEYKTCHQERRKEAAQRIILTERQLQTFRREHWAQDMLRDRSRTRSLLFSGFGSEEPQIRHTVLSLMEEFSENCGKSTKPEEVMNQPNAPFLQVYGNTLSFYQMQMMVGFLDAHSSPSYPPEAPGARIEAAFRNIFHGKPSEPLSASTFMQHLFKEVFCRRLEEEVKRNKTLAQWLEVHTQQPRTWLRVIEQFVAETREPTKNGNSTLPPLTDWATLFFDPKDDTPPFPLPFYRLLWDMANPGKEKECPKGYYLPLRDDPVLVLVTLIFACLYGGETKLSLPFRVEKVSPPFTVGEVIDVWLIEESALQMHYESTSGNGQKDNTPSRLKRIVTVPSRQGKMASGRDNRITEGKGGPLPHLRIGRWFAIPAGDLIREAEMPKGIEKVLAHFPITPSPPSARLTPLSKGTAP